MVDLLMHWDKGFSNIPSITRGYDGICAWGLTPSDIHEAQQLTLPFINPNSKLLSTYM